MATYSFKQECKVYIVRGPLRWKIEVYPDLNFSQTFEERSRSVKTLHDQNALFEEATINKANPANFNFTVLLTKGNDFDILGKWLTEGLEGDEALSSYDVYVDTGVDIFKLTKGVIERATFQTVRDSIITVSLDGSAARLTHYGTSSTVIPGTPQERDAVHTGIIPRRTIVEVDGVELTNIAGITIELSNEVQWIEYDTLHKSLYVTSASDSQYPEVFVVSKKVLSGTIQQYITNENSSKLNTWSTNSTLRIRVGDWDAYQLELNIPRAVLTNRIQPDAIFMQSYDFRMTHSPNQVYEVLKLRS